MDVVPLGPGFAAELRGVTLADVAANDAVYAQMRLLLDDHSVLVFRGQQVTDEAQLAFSRRFGPLEVTKVGSVGAGTNLVILTTIGPDGKVVAADSRMAMRNKANQLLVNCTGYFDELECSCRANAPARSFEALTNAA